MRPTPSDAAPVAARGTRHHRLRRAATWLHRWAGLVTAGFLLVVGLTGSLIAFDDELQALLAPELFIAPAPTPGAAPLHPIELRERVLARFPMVRVDWLDLAVVSGRAMLFGVEPAAGGGPPLDATEVFVDPYTGRILGSRRNGDLSQGVKNLMPFVYRLHDSLALGDAGRFLLGLVALLWTLDCFVGLYLTLPLRPAAERRPAARWLQRWRPAWLVRWSGGAARVNFDLHRAGSLWIWPMLLVLAWSSVGFNLPGVYRAAMRWTIGYAEPAATAPLAAPTAEDRGAPMDWYAAHARLRDAMSELARQEGFSVLRERLMFFEADGHRYGYRVLSTRDVGKLGNTSLAVDATTGRLLQTDVPTGRRAGNTITTWIMALHTATVGGLAMQVFVSATGVLLAVLCVTGVVVWWRKRRARRWTRPGQLLPRRRR